MLTSVQKAFYAENGYVMVKDAVTPDQLQRMQDVTAALIDASRSVSQSDDVYDLDRGHGPDSPRLTRIKLPHKRDPVFHEVLTRSGVTQVLNDLLGPDINLITSKLNTKAPGGGAAVEWHQDWAFYPHTNDDLLAVGLLLEDVEPDNGPLLVIPGTHKGPILSHEAGGVFCGAINPDDPLFERDRAVTLTGKAGSLSVHHVRTLHGSAPNVSDRARKILFFEVARADAWPILGASSYIHALGQRAFWDDLQDRTITGKPCLTPRLENVPVRMPLPPAADITSIFKTQASGGAKSAFG
ncbi:phytanoyl-CoA dioxygenase family protein [Puniceibacterium sp. IMCC21224]|uniref:phytanoyl-CoA dioxygenase family protein n=1 Tax=Puniceibacterium sp. IMCC21224 TaxID=1618204 RepID=UPI00064DF489|nr:phytanoyl-CoA dioxygenase family protein [Puniceibacterium sp. IMCC21224]KMK68256.1 protein involved in biosynthesis of mitomycin antibiotics/polyketide fumonisin [Puniceibacterium sp. IMCC21224]